MNILRLTLILLTWRIWWAPNNASKWQMRFNLAVKGLISQKTIFCAVVTVSHRWHYLDIQCQHKGLPWLQTFITRKLRGIRIFLSLLTLVSKILCRVYCYVTVAYVCVPRSFLVTNVCNQGRTLCSLCRFLRSGFNRLGIVPFERTEPLRFHESSASAGGSVLHQDSGIAH
jgi:hypothetical protein